MKPTADRDAEARTLGPFLARTLLVVAVLIACLVLWRLRDAAAVAFGSVLIGVGLDGAAGWVRARTGAPRLPALAIVFAAIAALTALTFWVFQTAMAAQYDELARRVPQSIHALLSMMRADPLGREVLAQYHNGAFAGAATSAPTVVAGLLRSAASAATYGLVMLFGGVFLAIDPARYVKGALRLSPAARRGHYAEVLATLARALQRWLIGRLVIMVAVGVLASFGLWALGIDAPFALGLTGALLSFVPFVGALMATVPAMMIALVQSPVMVVWVALLFWGVHFVEGTFITPYVQDEAVDVPPVLSIFSTTVFTVLLGPIGVFLAGPLTVTVMLMVEVLYIEDVLGERLEPRRRRRLPFAAKAGSLLRFERGPESKS